MASLASLHIKKVPKCLVEVRDMHNALCDLVGSIEGSLGIDVHITPPAMKKKAKGQSKAEKPKGGKIRITPKKIAGQKSNSGGGGSAGSGSGSASELHYLDASIQIDIDANGVKLLNRSTNHYVKMFATGAFAVHNASNGKEVLIAPTDITHDMSIRTISICSGGVTKSMDILASAAY